MLNKEEWKDIPNYEGLYQISNYGIVKSLSKHKRNNSISQEMLLKNHINDSGYCVVELHKNKSRKVFRVHRLVAELFITNEQQKPCVNHIDGNKLNNCVDNLEWVTYKENMIHAVKNGLNKGCKKVKEVMKCEI